MTTTRQDAPTTERPHFATLLVMALDPKEIGERIRKRREVLHWTHQRLADEMDVELRTVQRWQDGELPRLNTLMELAEKMGVERSYFVEEEQEVPESQAVLMRGVAEGIAQLERSAENVLQQLDDVLERLARIEGAVSPGGETQPGQHTDIPRA